MNHYVTDAQHDTIPLVILSWCFSLSLLPPSREDTSNVKCFTKWTEEKDKTNDLQLLI